jgi:hypothetical protein
MTTDYSARAKNRAMYLPAGQSGTHNMAFRNPASVRPLGLPASLTSLADLDFLDRKNPLFTYDRALFSAGQYLSRTSPVVSHGVFSRRPGVTILTDSGGLQYGRNKQPWAGNASREWTLRFAELNGDEAIGLDIPTLAVAEGHPLFNTPEICLATTLDNNRYWLKHRNAETRFLAVLQGRTAAEAQWWYDGAKTTPMDGWAFGGVMRSDYLHLAETMLRLASDGLLAKDRNRIHVLGDSSLTQAVMLSALQHSLRIILQDDDLLITFDTASPSEMAAFGWAYRYARIDQSSFSMVPFKPPSFHANAGHDTPFPVRSSRLGTLMMVGEICSPSGNRQHGWDTLGNEMIINHNIESLLRGIDDANSALELPLGWQDEFAPQPVILAYNALRTMHQYPRDHMGHLLRSRASFKAL